MGAPWGLRMLLQIAVHTTCATRRLPASRASLCQKPLGLGSSMTSVLQGADGEDPSSFARAAGVPSEMSRNTPPGARILQQCTGGRVACCKRTRVQPMQRSRGRC